MFNTTLIALLEAECLEKPVKGPPAEPNVTQAGAIELRKVIAAIATRRQNLASAHNKLKQIAMKSGTNTSTYACQNLRVQAAHAWLDFTTKRWKKMTEWAKSKGKLEPHTHKLISFGDVQHGHAMKHMEIAHTDEPHPPMADVKFNGKSDLTHPSGEKFEIPDDLHSAFKHHKVEPENEEPEPEPEPEGKAADDAWLKKVGGEHKAISAAGLDSLSTSQQKSVIDTAKSFAPGEIDDYMAALDKKGVSIAQGAAFQVLKHAGKPAPVAQPWHKLSGGEQDALMKDVITKQLADSPDHKYDATDVHAVTQKLKAKGVEADSDLVVTLLDIAGKDFEHHPPAEPPAELPARGKTKVSDKTFAEVTKTLKQGLNAGHFTLDDKDTIKGVLADHGIEQPSDKLFNKFIDAITPEEDKPLSPGGHPWPLKDYSTPEEKKKIANTLKAFEGTPSWYPEGIPTPQALKLFKTALDKAGVPLKHADALQLMKDAAPKPQAKPPEAPPPPAAEAPPPPAKPKPVTYLDPDKMNKLSAAVRMHMINNAGMPSHGMLPSAAKQLLKDIGVDEASPEVHAIPHELAKAHLKTLNDLTPDETSKLGSWADAKIKTLAANAEKVDPVDLASELQTIASQMHGKIPTHTAAADIINSAVEKHQSGKSTGDYAPEDKAKIDDLAKSIAITSATHGKTYGEFKDMLGKQLGYAGLQLKPGSLGVAAIEAWDGNTNKKWDDLSQPQKELVIALSKKALEAGHNVQDTLAAHGLPHIKPDELKPLLKNLNKGKEPPVVPAKPEPVPPIEELSALVIATWNKLVGIGEPINAPSFFIEAKTVVADKLHGAEFSKEYGQPENEWLTTLWNHWYASLPPPAPAKPPEEAPKPAEPEPLKPTPIPAPNDDLANAHVLGWTKFKKIGAWNKLTLHQKNYLDAKINAAIAAGAHLTASGEIGEKKLAGVAHKIHGEFKADWSMKGVTQFNAEVVKKRLEELANKKPPEAAKPDPTTGDPPAAQPDDYLAMIAAVPAGTLNEKNDQAFKDIVKSVFIDKKWGGDFASPKQKNYFDSMLAKVKAALPASPGAPAPTVTPEPTPAPAPEVTPAMPASANALGMSFDEIKKLASLEKSATAPANLGDPPPLESEMWKGKGAFGGGGAHDKKFVATDEEGYPLKSKTFKTGATHAWMFKTDHNNPAIAYGEVAANRVQKLLGLGKTDRIWVEKDEHGVPGTMQHFSKQDDFRSLGDKTPWLNNPQKDSIAKQLQQYMVSNWLVDERDDHDGNFVIDKNGVVTSVDHGQAGKFFDSSQTLTSNLDWEPPSGVFQDPDKGFPKRMLKDWAAGKAVPLSALTDPEFETVIAKAEAIPSDIHKEMWRPYAEGLVAKHGKVAGFSTVASDKTVDGFLDAIDQRRKTIRSQVGDMFSHLAKTRAASLKAQGDKRALSTIEADIRDQIGLDDFLQGKHVVSQPDQKIVAKAAQEATDASPGWDEHQLPSASHVPHHEALAKAGVGGVDMMVGGKDVKDGRIQFFQLGDNPMATLMLEPWARAKLEARLPDGGPAMMGPPPPEKPEETPFKAPPKPDFLSTTEDLHKKILEAGGLTSDKMKADGTKLSKIEKHIDKWKKGEFDESGNQYLDKGYKAAQEMAQSADPVEKAAGDHFVAELDKVGTVVNGSFKMKDPNTVQADVRAALIPPFKPTEGQLAAQKKAKADVESAHKKATAEAKTVWEKNKKEAEDAYEKALAKYESDKAKAQAEAQSAGKLPAKLLDFYPVPSVKLASDPEGDDAVSTGSKFAGKYVHSWDSSDNDMHSYEIDLTDVVTGVAAAGGKVSATKKLIVHYVPSHTEGSGPGAARKFASRGGQVRIQFPAGSTKDQIRDYTQKVTHLLGSDIHPATHKEHELNYLRRMAWLRRIEGYKVGTVSLSSEPEGTMDEKINWWIEHFKKPPASSGEGGGLGYDPRYEPERTPTGQVKKTAGQVVLKKNPDGSFKKNTHYKPEAFDSGAGRLAFNRFDVTGDEMKKWMDDGLTLFKSSLGGHPKMSLTSMINSGAVFATEKRANVGMMAKGNAFTGMSSSADVRTGGSNEVFLYIAHKKPDSNGWGHFDPRLLMLTSAWHHAGDHYGAKAGYQVSGRTGSVQEEPKSLFDDPLVETVAAAKQHQNEVLVGDRVPFWNWVTRLNVSNQGLDPKAIIKKLKDAGITHAGPDKTPIEQVIK